jgi:hypothetical protein
MEPADKKRLAQRILGAYAAEYAQMLEFIDRYPDLQETPAQFQERCGQIALACFWRERQAEERPLAGPGERWFWDGDRCPVDREEYERLMGVGS